MATSTSAYLERRGCLHLDDLEAAFSKSDLPENIREEVHACLLTLIECVAGDTVDWLKYYELRKSNLNGLFFQCDEFANLSAETPLFAVNRSSFGNAGAIVEKHGIDNFGALIGELRKGISPLPAGMGKKKERDLWQRLLNLAYQVREDASVLNKLAAQHPLGGESPAQQSDVRAKLFDEMSEEVRNLSIGCLHLGAKAKKLKDAGLDTVGRLACTEITDLLNMPSMGRRTVERIEAALKALVGAQDEAGMVDWEEYTEAIGIELFPIEVSQSISFSGILQSLPEVLETAFLICESEEDCTILSKRIMAPPPERLTLEATSELFSEKVTRERVRQKEAKILERLADALIDDDYTGANFRFRPQFTHPWKVAADFFSDHPSDISFNDFVLGLEHAWKLNRQDFSSVLPLITAIITGELASGEDYRSAILYDTSAFHEGEYPVDDLPLKTLQIRKSAQVLNQSGIYSVGDYIRAVKTGKISVSESSHTRSVYDSIHDLARCTYADGSVDWWQYAELSGVAFLPRIDANDPRQFLHSIVPTAVDVLNSRRLSAIAAEVFRLRSSVGLEGRPTAEALAAQLGGHGSSVKRIETDMLRFLRAVFIERNLAIATAHISARFLNQWSFVESCFEDWENDTDRILIRLSQGWGLEKDEVTIYLPSIVAIVTGYPMGRLGRTYKNQERASLIEFDDVIEQDNQKGASENLEPQRIVLRGFRRRH